LTITLSSSYSILLHSNSHLFYTGVCLDVGVSCYIMHIDREWDIGGEELHHVHCGTAWQVFACCLPLL